MPKTADASESVIKKTVPFSREDINTVDTMLAKCLLVWELLQIPEFVELWERARKEPRNILTAIAPVLENINAGLSPEGRGAFLLGSSVFDLYDQNARVEAVVAAVRLGNLAKQVNDSLCVQGIHLNYRSDIQALVEPLGIPGFADVMMVWGIGTWDLNWVNGPVEGHGRDMLESMVVRGLTDLSPVEVIAETPSLFNKRVSQKMSSISRHLKQYNLPQRIHLWVRSVVMGETMAEIAGKECGIVGFSSLEWV
jgi:hypothetical protein